MELMESILSLLRKERVLMNKMVEADEKKDSLLFNTLKSYYKEYMTEVNKEINLLLKQNDYKKVMEFLSNSIDIEDELSIDKMTLMSLINTEKINRYSNVLFNDNADSLSNKIVLLLYDIYIWNSNNYDNSFKKAIRCDLLCDLTNSNSIRNYFGGNYDKAEELSIPKNEYDKHKLINAYYSMLNNRILASNNLEILDGVINADDLNSKKEVYKLWFAAINIEMMNNHIIFPLTEVEMSDFTRKIVEDASEITNKYLSRDKEKKKEIIIKL